LGQYRHTEDDFRDANSCAGDDVGSFTRVIMYSASEVGAIIGNILLNGFNDGSVPSMAPPDYRSFFFRAFASLGGLGSEAPALVVVCIALI